MSIRLDSAGIAAVLQSAPVEAAVRQAAAAVAANASGETASGEPVPVETRERTASGGRLRSPRLAVDVMLAHPAGIRVEAKRGTLARAAAAAGLEVKSAPESDLVEYVTKAGKKRMATRAQVAAWTRGSR